MRTVFLYAVLFLAKWEAIHYFAGKASLKVESQMDTFKIWDAPCIMAKSINLLYYGLFPMACTAIYSPPELADG